MELSLETHFGRLMIKNASRNSMFSIMYWIKKEYAVKPQFIIFVGNTEKEKIDMEKR